MEDETEGAKREKRRKEQSIINETNGDLQDAPSGTLQPPHSNPPLKAQEKNRFGSIGWNLIAAKGATSRTTRTNAAPVTAGQKEYGSGGK